MEAEEIPSDEQALYHLNELIKYLESKGYSDSSDIMKVQDLREKVLLLL